MLFSVLFIEHKPKKGYKKRKILMKILYILLAANAIMHAQDIKPIPKSARLHYNQGLVSNDIIITIASTPSEQEVIDLANIPQRPINLLEIAFYKRGFPV